MPNFNSDTTIFAELTAISRLRLAANAERDVETIVDATSAGGVRDCGIEGYAITMLVGARGSRLCRARRGKNC